MLLVVLALGVASIAQAGEANAALQSWRAWVISGEGLWEDVHGHAPDSIASEDWTGAASLVASFRGDTDLRHEPDRLEGADAGTFD
jgi:hypothetical protein